MQGKNAQTPSFSPDGKRFAYSEFNSESGAGGIQIWTVPVEDSGGQLRTGKPELFFKSQFDEYFPVFSPDGKWLAYESNESGKNEVYVRSRKNRELFYQSDDQIMAVKYNVKNDVFVPEKPRVWAAKLAGATQFRGALWFDLAPDGKHLAVEVPVSTPEVPKPEHEVTLVFNFFDELRRRVPFTEPRP